MRRNGPVQYAVELDHVSKRYRIGTLSTLRGTLSTLLSRQRQSLIAQQVLWALHDVSFRMEPGTSLGLIGPNGAGKTTTLKLLSNITRPTSGRVVVRGRLSSLIELGAGFHPELTGRENIYLNGAILGLKREEISRKLDDIIAFAQLERFIDTPVKRYSSGMYVRLGFAVAAHVEPDILLVDEVLAVGDASFRHRCLNHMHILRRNGTALVFVSHNMHMIRNICDSALLLAQGHLLSEGNPSDVIAAYQKLLMNGDTPGISSEGHAQLSFDSQGSIFITEIEVLSPQMEADRRSFDSRFPTKVHIHYRTTSLQPIGRIDVRVLREDGTLCSAIDSSRFADAHPELSELSGAGVIEVTYDPLQLTAGKYSVVVQITDPSDAIVIASGQSQPFYVSSEYSSAQWGVYVPHVHWMKRSQEVGEASEVRA